MTDRDTRVRKAPGLIQVTSARTGRVTYEIRWSWLAADGVRHHGCQRVRTYDEARKMLAARQHAVATGTYAPASHETVGQYAERYFARQATVWQSSTTYQRRRQWANHLAPRLGGRRLTAVTRAECQRLIDELAVTRQPQTVHNIWGLLSSLLSAAVTDGLIDRNPAHRLTLPAIRQSTVTTWTAAQARHFLGMTAAHPHGALYHLLLATGMRIGEAQALRWAALDLETGVVHVTDTMRRTTRGALAPAHGTKGAKARDIPLTPGCVAALSAHRDRQAEQRRAARVWDVRGFVFTGDHGQPLEPETMRRWFAEAIDAAGLPRLTFHGLRHSCATLLLEAGVSERAIQDLLGHSSVQTTMAVYGHVTANLRNQTRTALAGLLDAPAQESDAGVQ